MKHGFSVTFHRETNDSSKPAQEELSEVRVKYCKVNSDLILAVDSQNPHGRTDSRNFVFYVTKRTAKAVQTYTRCCKYTQALMSEVVCNAHIINDL